MIKLYDWLMQIEGRYLVPLFSCNGLILNLRQKNDRTLLMRSSEMENAVIRTVEDHLHIENWEGLLYVMGKGEGASFRPMYIGKAEKKGITRPISANIHNIRRNKHMFARWGDGVDYHIGDLSHVIFKFKAYRKPTKKHQRWAEALFDSYDPPKLKEPVNFYIAPWFTGNIGLSGLPCSLPAVEKELIAIASVQYADDLLNVDGT